MESFNLAYLEEMKQRLGLDLISTAGIGGEGGTFCGLPPTVREMPFAIVIAKRVSRTVLDTLEDGPNLVYYHHYRQVNSLLDQAAQKIMFEIETKGYRALPIAASQLVDWNRQAGHVSHKRLGWLAGLGWRGRNSLLVTERWGAQVRLASVLTDMPLQAGSPLLRDCGRCMRCVGACPSAAIAENVEDFDATACFEKLKEFKKTRGIGQFVCGMCVKACRRQWAPE